MRTVHESRAATVLYKLVLGSAARGVFLLPANVCTVVPWTLLTAGRQIEFIDIDPETLALDWGLAKRRINDPHREPVGGLVYVRAYGAMDQKIVDRFRQLKRDHPGTLLVDDRCLAPPQPDLTMEDLQSADAVLFSTGYSKYVDLGWGGFAHLAPGIPYVDAEESFKEGRYGRLQALEKRAMERGHSIRAATGMAPERALCDYRGWLDVRPPRTGWATYRDALLAERTRISALKEEYNRAYRERVPVDLQLPAPFQQWRFQIQVTCKERLLQEIFAAGLFASSHFYPSAALFGELGSPVAAQLHRRIVNLFNDRYVNRDQVCRLASIVEATYSKCTDGPVD